MTPDSDNNICAWPLPPAWWHCSRKMQHFPPDCSRTLFLMGSAELSALACSWTWGLLLHSYLVCQDWDSGIFDWKSGQCPSTKPWSSIWNALCLEVSGQNWEWGVLYGQGRLHEEKKVGSHETWDTPHARKASYRILPCHLLSLWAAPEIHRTQNDSLKYPFSLSSWIAEPLLHTHIFSTGIVLSSSNSPVI